MKEVIEMILGEKLKEVRKENGLSQEQLSSQLLNMSIDYLINDDGTSDEVNMHKSKSEEK